MNAVQASAVAELRRRFPAAHPWRGEYTGSWWALTRDRYGRYLLLEAPDPATLARRLEACGTPMAPRFSRPSLMTGAAARSTQSPPRASRPAAPPDHTRAPSQRRRLFGGITTALSRFVGRCGLKTTAPYAAPHQTKPHPPQRRGAPRPEHRHSPRQLA